MPVLAQRDSYLRTLRTIVSWCEPAGEAYHVGLENTVLYPEGGGQPADTGTIAGRRVLDVQWGESGAVHIVDGLLEAGSAVEVAVDWERRYDLMQQHTAQHLVTAIAADELGLPTISFHLGAEYSAIEFAAAGAASPDALRELQARANEEIRAGRAVTAREVSPAEYESLDVRSRGLPAGHAGPVRLIEIEGLDLNTCGGTHVKSTAELQMITLGRVESTTDGFRVHYFAGGRVLRRIEASAARDARLSGLLSCGADEFEAAVGRLQEQNRSAGKNVTRLTVELAELVAERVCGGGPAHYHLVGGDFGGLNQLAAAFERRAGGRVAVFTAGDKFAELFLVVGDEGAVAELGPRVRDVVRGKGGGRGGRFQGKAGAQVEPAEVAALLA